MAQGKGGIVSSLASHLQGKKQVLPPVPALAQLSASVWVVLGHNPGPYTLTGTNTYLVGTGKKRVLIDSGEGRPEYIPQLETALTRAGATGLSEIVVTHWHHDHLGGVPSVIERFGRVPVRKFMPAEPEPTFGGEGAVDPFDTWPEDGFVPLRDGEVIATEGATLEVLHTPGHADDHVVLVHREEGSLFSGDNVLGVGTSVFRDLHTYMASLRRMREAAVIGGVGTIYSSHGPVVPDAVRRLDEYIAHREARTAQVEAALPPPGAPTGLSCVQITRAIYTEHPEALIAPAARNTWLVLESLERDGRAVGSGGAGFAERTWRKADCAKM